MVVTAINKDNIERVTNLIPANLKCLDYPGRGIMGLLDEADNGKYKPVGVLVFDIEDEPVDDEQIIKVSKLKWLYVLEEYRGKEAADILMQSYFKALEFVKIAVVVCDIPWDEQYNRMCAYLEEWGFEGSLEEIGTLSLTLKELEGIKKVPCQGIVSLGDITKADFINFFEKISIDERPQNVFDKYYFYDPELSCAITDEKGIRDIILVYACGNEYINVDYLYADADDKLDLLKIVYHAYSHVLEKFNADTAIDIECRNDVTANVLDYFVENASPSIVRKYAYNMLKVEE